MGVAVELFDDLAEAGRDAAAALGREAKPSLFDRLDWYRLVAEYCPPPGKLVVIRARDGERSAWLFVAVQGGRARRWASWYSLRYGPVGDSGLLPAIAAALRVGGIGRVELYPVENSQAMRRGFREAGWIVFEREGTANWRTRTEGMSFEEWWAARPARLRNTAERKARSAGLDVEIHDSFDEDAWSAYEEVYARSWKPEEGSPAFLRALAEAEGAAGTLRLGIGRKDGRPIAAQLWLVENGTATIHKLAYDEEAKALSPGTVLSLAMFRRAIDEDRVASIDYGTGDEAYKADWMDERRTRWRVDAFDPRSFSGIAGAARAAASALVARLRSR